MKWLLYLLFLISTTANALTVDIIRKNESASFVHILFLSATFGEYRCLDDLIEKSKFLEFLKIKSFDVNINEITSSNNLDSIESLIINKIKIGHYDFVIILDESRIFTEDFYKTLEQNNPNKIITISHNVDSDITLFIDFNRFFLLLLELDIFDSYDVYYLHNKNNPINDLYYSLLTSNSNDNEFSMHSIQLTYISDLNRLIDKVKSKHGIIFISNLDMLYDDVSGKTISQTDIMDILSNYQISTLNISHTSCNCQTINSAFYLLWSHSELIDIIDSIITQRKLENSREVYILPSKFNINLSLNNDILKSPDVKKLKLLLEFTDDVILKK